MTTKTISFTKDKFDVIATVQHTRPYAKWIADNDNDYYGEYEILDMMVLKGGIPVDKHSVSWEDVIREFEFVVETQQVEYQEAVEEDDYWWDEDGY